MSPKRLQDRTQSSLQQRLAKNCYWDDLEHILWIDCQRILPARGVVKVISWDNMMLDANPIPAYPPEFKIFTWSNYSQLAYWRKQIPKWVQDSCALFPTHQLTLLHYCGKYPQILELLDQAPLLAWRLISSGLQEPEVVALLSGKRVEMAAQMGWPGKEETVKFLRNLRLRWVNQEIAEQVELCLLDERRLQALQSLPRINSMALSLAARFPELIGSRLHQALAQLPCRPMQCQSMVALLEDAYRLAEAYALPDQEIARIGKSRYLVEVTQIYQAWLSTAIESALQDEEQAMPVLSERLKASSQPFEVLDALEDWIQLSLWQQHAWFIDFPDQKNAADLKLVAWLDEGKVWGALLSTLGGEEGESSQIVRVRGEENSLSDAKPLSDLHLWQATGKL
ncbi:MAG: hypothetical protein R3189_05960 [Thiomicrorhabdus chilensis]|uniref:hypothetical protein n=1 Tax=Thiomicrorhabdus chilensis TaxID=63656 RepID=UPI00299F3D78|nr:hypothetical protein [Thiomicrorhabdus chilensis]MDX1347777.1 hypothetical protein [Thiomicrorhabdus chilensis]